MYVIIIPRRCHVALSHGLHPLYPLLSQWRLSRVSLLISDSIYIQPTSVFDRTTCSRFQQAPRYILLAYLSDCRRDNYR